jgi:hypothetical protein
MLFIEKQKTQKKKPWNALLASPMERHIVTSYWASGLVVAALILCLDREVEKNPVQRSNSYGYIYTLYNVSTKKTM